MIRAGHLVILIAVSLLVLGVVMVHSASMSLGGSTTLQGVLMSRPTALAIGAVLCLMLGSCVPVERLGHARGVRSPAPWILVACLVVLLAVYIPGVGREANGALRWIQLGPIGFQPSEIAKWGLPIAIACYAARHAASMPRFVTGFAAPLLVVAVICGIIAVSDLGTAILIMVVAMAMLVAAGARLLYPLIAAPALLAGAAFMVMVSPYRRNRILAYLDPFQDQAGIGYHIIQSMAAINGGELTGRGLGNSIQKFGYLPESNTDFIFAIICEELGAVGATMVVLLYIALIIAGISILRGVGGSSPSLVHATEFDRSSAPLSPEHSGRPEPGSAVAALPAPGDFSRILGFGILMTVAVQAAINLSVVTGLAPTKGIALPLVSHGGTGWLLTAFSLGLLVSMDRSLARGEIARGIDSTRLDPGDSEADGSPSGGGTDSEPAPPVAAA